MLQLLGRLALALSNYSLLLARLRIVEVASSITAVVRRSGGRPLQGRLVTILRRSGRLFRLLLSLDDLSLVFGFLATLHFEQLMRQHGLGVINLEFQLLLDWVKVLLHT